MAKSGRNARCPCGSGRKNKHCCLGRAQDERRLGRATGTVWERLQEWTVANHPEHLEAAIDELFAGDARTITAETGDLLCSYAHLDRHLPDGRTAIQRFAELAPLDAVERTAATELCGAHLSLWRVRTTDPGVSIELEEVVGDSVVVVQSESISRGVARWDVLLGRVIKIAHGHELWGPARIFTAAEEEEIVVEVERLAGERVIAPRDVFTQCAAELLRFEPASRTAARCFFTFEGDEVVDASARWALADAGTGAALEGHPDLLYTDDTVDGEGICLEWTGPRQELAALRPELPSGAVLLEASAVFFDFDEGRATMDPSRIGLGTFELRPGELTFCGISAQRLDGAIALVADTLGTRARLIERCVAPLEGVRARCGDPDDTDAGVPQEVHEAVIAGFARARLVRALDEPDPRLSGLSPREAARSPRHREGVERWLRTLENSAAHGAAAQGTAPDADMLRTELGMPDQRLHDAA